jgi:zinc and cadmium transporter
MISETQLLILYSGLIIASSLLGGYAPRWIKLNHSRMQVALSFVSGVLLGIGVLHLIPHSAQELTGTDPNEDKLHHALHLTAGLVLAGFMATFFLQRIFHFHTHEVYDPEEKPAPSPALPIIQLHDHDHAAHPQHEHGPNCDHGHDHVLPSGRWTWIGVFFGLTMHSVIDGLALGAAVRAGISDGQGASLFAGLGFFLAVVLHKPFDSLSIVSLMHMSGRSKRAIALVNMGYAVIAPLGIALFYFGISQHGSASGELLGGTMAFAAGACICIAASDLLPELQFHTHDRLKLSAALLLGLALAWVLVLIEDQGHDHGGPNGHNHQGHEHKHDHSGHKH